jgi:hypothetical protein
MEESDPVKRFWERINVVTMEHILNAKNLVHANSELDKAFVRDDPITPMERNVDGKVEYDELEEVEIAVVDDLTVDEFEVELGYEIRTLHSDLVDEYSLLRECY